MAPPTVHRETRQPVVIQVFKVFSVTSHVGRVHSWSPGSFYEACFQYCRQFYGWRLLEFTSPSNTNKTRDDSTMFFADSECLAFLTLLSLDQHSTKANAVENYLWLQMSPVYKADLKALRSWVGGGYLPRLTGWYESERRWPKVRNAGLLDGELPHQLHSRGLLSAIGNVKSQPSVP